MKKINFCYAFLLQILVLSTSISLTNCSSNSSLHDRYSTLFKFNNNGREYLIVGYPAKDAEGYNLLIGKEKDNVFLKCIDKQHNGTLDEVLAGNISLEEANKIYKKGITMAESQGSIKKIDFERYYRNTTKNYYCEIRTYILVSGERYNIFMLVKKQTNNTLTILDEGADGSLDNFMEGDGNIKEYQLLYASVIQKGIEDNKIKFEGGIYQVIIN